MVYKRDRQTCNFKAIKYRWCARETDKHVILKLSITDGDTHVSEGLGTIGHVVGSGQVYKQSILVPTRSITKLTQTQE